MRRPRIPRRWLLVATAALGWVVAAALAVMLASTGPTAASRASAPAMPQAVSTSATAATPAAQRTQAAPSTAPSPSATKATYDPLGDNYSHPRLKPISLPGTSPPVWRGQAESYFVEAMSYLHHLALAQGMNTRLPGYAVLHYQEVVECTHGGEGNAVDDPDHWSISVAVAYCKELHGFLLGPKSFTHPPYPYSLGPLRGVFRAYIDAQFGDQYRAWCIEGALYRGLVHRGVVSHADWLAAYNSDDPYLDGTASSDRTHELNNGYLQPSSC